MKKSYASMLDKSLPVHSAQPCAATRCAEPRYYRISVLRGHAGAGKHGEITFYIVAKNINDAIMIARRMPGVKHSRPVLSAQEIALEEYLEGKTVSAYHRDTATILTL